MKKMRFLAVLLAVVCMACVFVLAACDDTSEVPGEGGDNGTPNTELTPGGEQTPGGETPGGDQTPHTHTWGDWSVTTPATCGVAGVETRTCTCGASETQPVAATEEHTYNSSNVCTVCNTALKYTKGLEYEQIYLEDAYAVIGIGTATDSKIVIPYYYNEQPVTKIGRYAFENCDSLTSITIPASVTSISYNAFENCESLTTVDFGDSSQLTSIGDHAFEDCSSLTSITIPAGVTTIDSFTFYNCDSLTSITIPASVTTIGEYAFQTCNGLTTVEFGANSQLTSIRGLAFNACSNLASITIPASVTSIGWGAFDGCTNLIQIESGIAYVDKWVIGCRFDATSVILRENTVGIGYSAFENCESLTTVDFGDSSQLTSIGDHAFEDCSSLTTVKFGANSQLTSIGNSAFEYCDSLTSITIPASVTSIGEDAFEYCDSLTSITIPASVTSIGEDAFSCCSSRTSVYISDLAAWCNIDFASYGSNPLYYSCNLYVNGKKLTGDVVLPEDVKQIPAYAFYGCDQIKSIVIPSSVTYIGESAFEGCNALQSISLPSVFSNGYNYSKHFGHIFGRSTSYVADDQYHLKGIESYKDVYYTFKIPSSLKTVILTGGTNISERSFQNCNTLNSIVCSETVKIIDAYAFYGCSGLANVSFLGPVSGIGKEAFKNCSSLNAVYITDLAAWCNIGLGSASDNPLYYAKNLYVNGILATNLEIPNTVRYIRKYAFYNCKSITSVTIPASVTSIDNYAFYDCNSLTSVYINDLAAWCDIEFGYSSANPLCYAGNLYLNENLVTALEFPNTVTSIEDYAFYGCKSITSVTIPASVTSIGSSAFFFCYKLIEVYNLSSLNITADSSDYGYVGEYAKNVYTATEGEKKTFIDSNGYIFYDDGTNRYLMGYTGTDVVVTLPASCNGNDYEIYKFAFYERIDLTSVTILASVTSIGEHAFQYCSNLTSITIPASVTSIGGDAFYNCDSLTSVYINDLAAWCNIEFGSYDANPLYYANNLYVNGNLVTHLEIPTGVTCIKGYAFYDCTSIISVSIPASVTSIGVDVFSSCDSLTTITIPASVTSIGDDAFSYCDGLTAVYITDLAAWCNIEFGSYDANPLYYANNLYVNGNLVTHLEIPNGVTSIKDNAFFYCTSITSVTIPASVTSIGWGAFYKCDRLTTVYYGGSASDWSNITIGSDNSYFTSATRYYYSAEEPTVAGNWWYYDNDGKVAVWPQ